MNPVFMSHNVISHTTVSNITMHNCQVHADGLATEQHSSCVYFSYKIQLT